MNYTPNKNKMSRLWRKEKELDEKPFLDYSNIRIN